MHRTIFIMPWIWAFSDGPVLRHFRLSLLYPRFTKTAKTGSHRSRPCGPVSVNVGNPKEILVRVKGHLGDPKEIFGIWRSSGDKEKISCCLKKS